MIEKSDDIHNNGAGMAILYSKRILLPFVGVVQVADLGWARALSLNGITWTVRYQQHENEQTRKGHLNYDPRVNIALMLNIEKDEMTYRAIRTDLDPGQSEIDSQRFFETIKSAHIPFEAADHYEYWLLDGDDKTPLALLRTCIEETEMTVNTPPPVWHAIPAAEMAVADPLAQNETYYQPPVNYRLQESVETQAGNKPRAAWFNRADTDNDDFPACLIKQEWDDAECQRLCDLYLQRLAPRLLMLSTLAHKLREGLEQAAIQHPIEVDNYYHLYPEVINDDLLSAARVEARLRQANET
jgi:hypothetical protein